MAQKRSTAELAERVEQTAAARSSGEQKTMDQWLQTYAADFEAALPQYVDPERFMRLTLNTLRWEPELRNCDPFSVIGAMMQCAQLGLEPSGPLDHVYMSPRNVNVGTKQKPQWIKRVQLTIGYQGYIELAQRTGAVKKIIGDVVRERDDYELWLEDGEQRIHHRRPKLGVDRGDVIGAYAVASMVDGGVIARDVDMEAIERARSSSDAGKQGKGPWETDFDAMAIKTAVRRLWKWLPKTEEAAAGYVLDGKVVAGLPELPIAEALPPQLDAGALEEEGAEPEPEEDPERPFEDGGS